MQEVIYRELDGTGDVVGSCPTCGGEVFVFGLGGFDEIVVRQDIWPDEGSSEHHCGWAVAALR